ncbi:hypothetical protein LTR17_007584 [Elasticomyces elasticus]|nr:hypothetical protein LTR17_007584 [Elasticomyces elasticus]
MAVIKDSDSGGGQKPGTKRKPQTEDPSIPDDTLSKKPKMTSAGTPTPAAVDNPRPRLRRRPPKQQPAQEASSSPVADMAQATPNESTDQTTTATSAPAAGVQGGPASDFTLILSSATAAYQLSGKQAAAAYLRGYIARGMITPVSAESTARDQARRDLVNQRYQCLAATLISLPVDKRNPVINAWAHSHAETALLFLLPGQPEKVRAAMAQLRFYAPVSSV